MHVQTYRRGLLYAGLGAVAFSGKAIVAKLMYKLGADAFSVVGLRMAMAFPMFLAMVWWSSREAAARPALTRHQWWQIVGLGITGYYLASTLDFMGLQYISAGLERAILYLNPTLVLVLSAIFLKHRAGWASWAAVALAYSGVAVVWLHDWDVAHLASAQAEGMAPAQAIAVGSLLVLGSALSYAIYLMGSGQLVQKLGSFSLVGRASCVACVLCVLQWLLVWGLSEGRVGSLANLGWQVYALSAVNAVLCTALPVWLVMQGVRLLGASVASQVGMVGPLSTLWMASWFLGEPITSQLMFGTATILLGIVWLSKIRQPAK